MITAGIFDIGGVLLKWSNQYMFEDIIKTLKVSDAVLAKYWDENVHLLGTGKITEEEFWKRFVHEAGITEPLPEKSLFLREFEKRFTVNESILSLAMKLKANNFKIGILSNTIEPHLQFMKSQGLFHNFDVTVFSNEVGYEKPSPEIYHITLDRLEVTPDQAFFIDDLPENVEGAEDLGIKGILYDGVHEIDAQFKELGVRL